MRQGTTIFVRYMYQPSLRPEARAFCEQIYAVRLHHEAVRAHIEQAPKLQVAGVGQSISALYEQLRNAAENAEEHLLLERATRRFLTRNLSFHVRKTPKNIGEELVVELTQAGYLGNGTVALATVEAIDQLIIKHHADFWYLRDANVAQAEATAWTLDVMSVEVEELLGDDHLMQNALVHFAHQKYRTLLADDIVPGEEQAFDLSLFVAIHQSLLRSDRARIRREVLRLYVSQSRSVESLIEFNKRVDIVFTSELTGKLNRAVIKYGAPLRVLKEMIRETESVDVLLADRKKFLAAYETRLQTVYDDVAKRLNRGIVKSIIFLVITKVIIGLAIEIPYDILIHGYIMWLPLAINILFPPLYMASLKWSFKMPGAANKQATTQAIDRMLYSLGEDDKTVTLKPKHASTVMSVLYAMMFVVSFSILVLILALLKFNIVQGIIFFVFLSTASFLGFRLSRMVRELEMFASRQNFFDAIRDFFYTPYIMVGRWISDKYSRVNIITLLLDMLIELPLKTVLRMVRQWMRFLNDKRDEM